MATFDHTLTVRFQEADRAGIMFFGRIFDYCHTAIEELLEAADCGIAANFDAKTGGFGMPLVHAEADYLAPCRHGERLTIAVSLERMGTSSVTFAFAIHGPHRDSTTDAESGDLRARARFVHSCVALDSFTKCPVPDVLRDGLRRLGLLAD